MSRVEAWLDGIAVMTAYILSSGVVLVSPVECTRETANLSVSNSEV
jgi:hypothetical protein